MSHERSIFIIKPEAYDRRDEICRFVLENSTLTIAEHIDIKISRDDVHELYVDDLTSDLLHAAEIHLANKMVRVCIVEGDNAIDILQDLAGRHYDNTQCDVGTIRRTFGSPATVQYGSITYFLNAVHKASRTEAPSALAWYERIKKKKALMHEVTSRP